MAANIRAEDRKIYSYNTVIYEVLHDGGQSATSPSIHPLPHGTRNNTTYTAPTSQ
jgi:hypothetical protein